MSVFGEIAKNVGEEVASKLIPVGENIVGDIAKSAKTQIARGNKVSAPTKEFLKGDTRFLYGDVLHHGEGKAFADTEAISNALNKSKSLGGGGKVYAYDPNSSIIENKNPDLLNKQYKNIISNYVLNTLPPEARSTVLKDISNALEYYNGTGLISVRSAEDVGTIKNGIPTADGGVITSKGTYQKGYTKKELEDELKNYFNNITVSKTSKGTLTAQVREPKGKDWGKTDVKPREISVEDWYNSHNYDNTPSAKSELKYSQLEKQFKKSKYPSIVKYSENVVTGVTNLISGFHTMEKNGVPRKYTGKLMDSILQRHANTPIDKGNYERREILNKEIELASHQLRSLDEVGREFYIRMLPEWQGDLSSLLNFVREDAAQTAKDNARELARKSQMNKGVEKGLGL